MEGIEVTIPCGDGNQNLKWLALTAAARIGRIVKKDGRIRQREIIGSCDQLKTALPSMLSCSRWSSKDADDHLNLKNTAEDSLNDALETVGASYDISTRKDIWTPEN